LTSEPLCVSCPIVSSAANTSGLPSQPQPAPLGNADVLLHLVHQLILFGRRLVDKVERSFETPQFQDVFRIFGSNDVELILTRLFRGLQLAMALARYLAERASSGRDINPPPMRTSGGRRSAAGSDANAGRTRKLRPNHDSLPVRLLTEAELDELVRRRPIGATLVDIGKDFSVTPGELGYETWREFVLALVDYNGSLIALHNHTVQRMAWDDNAVDVLAPAGMPPVVPYSHPLAPLAPLAAAPQSAEPPPLHEVAAATGPP
jgi:hypothetical protein